MEHERIIYVYADFLPHCNELVGKLYVSDTRGREGYSFEYESEWLENECTFLDPELHLYKGRQYVQGDKNIFGVFADSCPDRWGRLLMKRREAIAANKNGEKPKKLLESDFLIGVYDKARMGGLRFKISEDGVFLSDDKEWATPPWTSLRKLEHATSAFENDDSALEEKWLKQLIAPGSSLGGARPKASVMAPDQSLWIAKFPSKHDEQNSGAWEMVVHDLAKMCGIDVPEARLEKFSKLGSTYLVKRFDRKGEQRIHFSSAMTMLGKTDGAGAYDGSSYLEIVSFLKANGARPKEDLRELWKRIVFSMAVSNTDDHFRNHGFILSESGWVLSPMYDVNPDIYGDNLSLNVNEDDSSIDFDLAIEAAPYYEVSSEDAMKIVDDLKRIVNTSWRDIANKYGISRGETERMKPAFMACENPTVAK
ncbi:MAG: type II toxin-antitoxin system HipA family toxin [Lachnospiraceae bacterium]